MSVELLFSSWWTVPLSPCVKGWWNILKYSLKSTVLCIILVRSIFLFSKKWKKYLWMLCRWYFVPMLSRVSRVKRTQIGSVDLGGKNGKNIISMNVVSMIFCANVKQSVEGQTYTWFSFELGGYCQLEGNISERVGELDSQGLTEGKRIIRRPRPTSPHPNYQNGPPFQITLLHTWKCETRNRARLTKMIYFSQ